MEKLLPIKVRLIISSKEDINTYLQNKKQINVFSDKQIETYITNFLIKNSIQECDEESISLIVRKQIEGFINIHKDLLNKDKYLKSNTFPDIENLNIIQYDDINEIFTIYKTIDSRISDDVFDYRMYYYNKYKSLVPYKKTTDTSTKPEIIFNRDYDVFIDNQLCKILVKDSNKYEVSKSKKRNNYKPFNNRNYLYDTVNLTNDYIYTVPYAFVEYKSKQYNDKDKPSIKSLPFLHTFERFIDEFENIDSEIYKKILDRLSYLYDNATPDKIEYSKEDIDNVSINSRNIPSIFKTGYSQSNLVSDLLNLQKDKQNEKINTSLYTELYDKLIKEKPEEVKVSEIKFDRSILNDKDTFTDYLSKLSNRNKFISSEYKIKFIKAILAINNTNTNTNTNTFESSPEVPIKLENNRKLYFDVSYELKLIEKALDDTNYKGNFQTDLDSVFGVDTESIFNRKPMDGNDDRDTVITRSDLDDEIKRRSEVKTVNINDILQDEEFKELKESPIILHCFNNVLKLLTVLSPISNIRIDVKNIMINVIANISTSIKSDVSNLIDKYNNLFNETNENDIISKINTYISNKLDDIAMSPDVDKKMGTLHNIYIDIISNIFTRCISYWIINIVENSFNDKTNFITKFELCEDKNIQQLYKDYYYVYGVIDIKKNLKKNDIRYLVKCINYLINGKKDTDFMNGLYNSIYYTYSDDNMKKIYETLYKYSYFSSFISKSKASLTIGNKNLEKLKEALEKPGATVDYITGKYINMLKVLPSIYNEKAILTNSYPGCCFQTIDDFHPDKDIQEFKKTSLLYEDINKRLSEENVITKQRLYYKQVSEENIKNSSITSSTIKFESVENYISDDLEIKSISNIRKSLNDIVNNSLDNFSFVGSDRDFTFENVNNKYINNTYNSTDIKKVLSNITNIKFAQTIFEKLFTYVYSNKLFSSEIIELFIKIKDVLNQNISYENNLKNIYYYIICFIIYKINKPKTYDDIIIIINDTIKYDSSIPHDDIIKILANNREIYKNDIIKEMEDKKISVHNRKFYSELKQFKK